MIEDLMGFLLCLLLFWQCAWSSTCGGFQRSAGWMSDGSLAMFALSRLNAGLFGVNDTL